MNENSTNPTENLQEGMSVKKPLKSKGKAYLLLLFLGYLGLHRFYIHEKKTALMQLGIFGLTLISLVGMVLGFSFQASGLVFFFSSSTMMLCLFIVIWWLMDLILLNKMVDDCNIKIIHANKA